MAESPPKRIENTVGKGEIACCKQYFPSQSVFKRLLLQTSENQGLFGTGLKKLIMRFSFKIWKFRGATSTLLLEEMCSEMCVCKDSLAFDCTVKPVLETTCINLLPDNKILD